MSVHHGHPGPYRSCSEPDCFAARARYGKRWKLDDAHGVRRSVDPGPAQMHVASLLGAGWSLRAIAGAANLSPSTVARLRDRNNKQLSRVPAERILAVTGLPGRPSSQTTQPFVSRVGTVRRVQALMFMGWSHDDLLEEYGIRSANLVNQPGRWVRRSTYDQVAEIYRRLSNQLGPSPRARLHAKRLGYHGPAAWDDIDHDAEPDLDDPDTEGTDDFDEAVVLRILAGDRLVATRAERREVLARWHTTGRTLADLERLTGWRADRYQDNHEDAA